MRDRHLIERLALLDPVDDMQPSRVDAENIMATIRLRIDASASRYEWSIARVKHARLLVACAALLLLVIPSLAFAGHLFSLFGGKPVPASTLTAHDWQVIGALGKGADLGTTSPQAALQGVGVSAIVQLPASGGPRFFVIKRSDGSACYAIGATGSSALFDSAECPGDGFPTRQDPVLDMSVFRGDAAGRTSVSKLEGFASDAIADIELRAADGRVVARAPVANNTYSDEPATPIADATTIVAVDQIGHDAWHECIGSDC